MVFTVRILPFFCGFLLEEKIPGKSIRVRTMVALPGCDLFSSARCKEIKTELKKYYSTFSSDCSVFVEIRILDHRFQTNPNWITSSGSLFCMITM